MSFLNPELPEQLSSGQPDQLRQALFNLQMHLDLDEPLEGIPPVSVPMFAPVLPGLEMEEFRIFLNFLLGQVASAPALPRQIALDQLAAAVAERFTDDLLRWLHLIEDMEDSVDLLSGLARLLGPHLSQVTEARALRVKDWLWLYIDSTTAPTPQARSADDGRGEDGSEGPDRDGALAEAMAAAVTSWPDGPNITVVLQHLAWDLPRGRFPALEERAGIERR